MSLESEKAVWEILRREKFLDTRNRVARDKDPVG